MPGHIYSQCLSRTMGELTIPIPEPVDNKPQEDNDLSVYFNAVNKALNDK